MELILVRQEGCGPCDAMNKMAPEKAKKRGYTEKAELDVTSGGKSISEIKIQVIDTGKD